MASSPERSTTAAFDRYIAESQSRPRSGSANSTSLIASSSLPPPPRVRPKRSGATANSSLSASASSIANPNSNSSSNGSGIVKVGTGVVGSSNTSSSSSPLSLPGSSPPNKDSQIQAAAGMSGPNNSTRNGLNSSRPGFRADSTSGSGVGSGPGSTATANVNANGSDFRRPSASAVYGIGHHSERRSNSLSSANSYSNLFYRPSSEYIPTTNLPNVPHDVNRDSQALSFDETLSIEDYSDLLYPDLQIGVDSPRSQQPSLGEAHVHGPPTRKRIPSFVSEEPDGPESPVEFAELGRFSTGVTGVTPTGPSSLLGPSKVEKLLGINSGMPKGQSNKQGIEVGRRDSFIDFDTAQGDGSSSSQSGKTSTQGASPISANFPMFAVRRAESIEASQPNKTLNEYRVLVDSVRKKGESSEPSPRQESNRQIFVDGSDKKSARPIPSPVAIIESIVGQSPVSPMPGSPLSGSRPPTSNLLDQKERAELVRKTRKIVQVLGPSVAPVVGSIPRGSGSDSGGLRREALHRATRSDVLPLDDPKRDVTRGKQVKRDTPSPDEPRSSWEPLNRDTIYMTASERRHSSPISSSFSPDIHGGVDSDDGSLSSLGSIITPEKRAERNERPSSGSPTSFMELTDEEGVKTPKLRASSELRDSERPSSETANSGGKDARNIVARIESTPAATSKHHAPRKPSLTSTLSLSLSDEDKDAWSEYLRDLPLKDDSALERQRKREKLARINRYLGSKVPPELILGQGSVTPPPGPLYNDHQRKNTGPGNDGSVGSVTEWKRRRRSLSATTYSSWEPQPQLELEMRTKDTLSSTDRVLHVRRAQKIEQILGEQAFYHIPRPATAPLQHPFQDADETQSQAPSQGRRLQKLDPDGSKQFKQRSAPSWKDGRPSTAGSSRPSTAQSRPSTSQSQSQSMLSYSTAKGSEGSKYGKLGPTDAENNHESQTVVIPAPTFTVGTALGSPWEDVNVYDVLDISPRSLYGQQQSSSKTTVEPSVRTSRQFLDYTNRLNTLNRILDNDDRQSLHELHTVLSEDEEEGERDEKEHRERQGFSTSTPDLQDHYIKPRASLISIQSVATVSSYATLTPEPMAFQARRKRAAKLAHFFGASYRDLFGEVLDRIERGMLEEVSQGEMSREEMRQLMDQLNQLKSRQTQLT